MRIGLIDVDGHNFPNLALMKISAYHKSQGDTVEWCLPLDKYDIVYQCKVFDETYSPDIEWIPMADKVIKGGTGYGLNNTLPDEIEHIYPDYSIYPKLTKGKSFGHLSRGCPRGVNSASCRLKKEESLIRLPTSMNFGEGRNELNFSILTFSLARSIPNCFSSLLIARLM